MSKSGAWNMVQTGESFNGSTIDQLKQLPELTRKDLNLIARSGCAGQLVDAAGDSQRVQELLAQLKAEKERAKTAEKSAQNARKENAYFKELVKSAEAQTSKDAEKREEAESRYESALADISGLKEQNAQLKERVHDAEEALKHQPIVGVIDEEEVDRRAAEKARGLADARNAELAKDNADLKKQVAALHSKISDAAQADFENANSIAFSCRRAWDTGKGSYSRLVGEDLETTFASLCETLNSIREEAARLCRQPPEYDGGEEDE